MLKTADHTVKLALILFAHATPIHLNLPHILRTKAIDIRTLRVIISRFSKIDLCVWKTSGHTICRSTE